MANEKRKVVRRIKASTDGAKSTKVVATATVSKPQLDDSSLIQTEDTKTNKASTSTTKQLKKDTATKTTKVAPQKAADSKSNKEGGKAQPAERDAKAKSGHRRKSAGDSKKPFILFRPFIALGRYIRDSWRELRKVEWPSRRATWKMTLGIIIFCIIIGVFVLLCDWGSQWLIQEVVL